MNKDIDYDNLSSKEKELVHKLYENGYISRVSYLELTEKDSTQKRNSGWKLDVESQR